MRWKDRCQFREVEKTCEVNTQPGACWRWGGVKLLLSLSDLIIIWLVMTRCSPHTGLVYIVCPVIITAAFTQQAGAR